MQRLVMSASLLLLPVFAACGAREGREGGGPVVYADRASYTRVDATVAEIADATETAFFEFGVVLTGRKTQTDGLTLTGTQGDWEVIVSIERDPRDRLSELEVTVSRDQINFSKDRAEQIMRAIVQRAH